MYLGDKKLLTRFLMFHKRPVILVTTATTNCKYFRYKLVQSQTLHFWEVHLLYSWHLNTVLWIVKLCYYTANIWTAKNTTFCGVMIYPIVCTSTALLVFDYCPFVQSTADKWLPLVDCTNCSLYDIKNIAKNTNFHCVMIFSAHICSVLTTAQHFVQ